MLLRATLERYYERSHHPHILFYPTSFISYTIVLDLPLLLRIIVFNIHIHSSLTYILSHNITSCVICTYRGISIRHIHIAFPALFKNI